MNLFHPKRIALLLCALVSICCGSPGSFPTEAELADYKRQGNALIKEIEAFRSREGRYPNSLAEAKLTTATNRHGGLKYRLGKGHIPSYRVYIGGSSEYHFYLYYIKGMTEWGLDVD